MSSSTSKTVFPVSLRTSKSPRIIGIPPVESEHKIQTRNLLHNRMLLSSYVGKVHLTFSFKSM